VHFRSPFLSMGLPLRRTYVGKTNHELFGADIRTEAGKPGWTVLNG